MFASLFRAFNGTPTPAKAERTCRESFVNLCANFERTAPGDPVIALYRNADFRATFFKLAASACAACFAAPDKATQCLALRRAVVGFYERGYAAGLYLSKSDEERQVLSEGFFSVGTRAESDEHCVVEQQLYNAATLVFRGLADKYFGDFNTGDWFVVLSSTARTVIENQMDAAILRARNDVLLPLLEGALKTFRQTHEEVSAKVFAGENYSVDLTKFGDAMPPPSKVGARACAAVVK